MICDDFLELQSHVEALATGPLGRCDRRVSSPARRQNHSSPRSAAFTVAPAGTALNICVSGAW